MSEWIIGQIVQVMHWTDRLFSITVNAPVNSFKAGQFCRIGLNINGKKIQRAYSYVNSPCNKNLEFHIVLIPKGKLSPRLYEMKSGDKLMITKKPEGFFIIQKIPSCENLWMLATGTAIGPYLSILEHNKGLEKFNRIILIYAVRFTKDLVYLPKIMKLKEIYNGKLHIQTIVSREKTYKSLFGRIPLLISNGSLEYKLNLEISYKNTHFMLCGNPNMVNETQKVLIKKYKMVKNLKNKPGNITSENYW